MVEVPAEYLTSTISEADFQRTVIEWAHAYGWRVAHFRPCRTAKGWRTPVEADGAGFPDLIMVRRLRMIAAELKAERGRVTMAQGDWLEALDFAGAECVVWRPSDMAEIEATLR